MLLLADLLLSGDGVEYVAEGEEGFEGLDEGEEEDEGAEGDDGQE